MATKTKKAQSIVKRLDQLSQQIVALSDLHTKAFERIKALELRAAWAPEKSTKPAHTKKEWGQIGPYLFTEGTVPAHEAVRGILAGLFNQLEEEGLVKIVGVEGLKGGSPAYFVHDWLRLLDEVGSHYSRVCISEQEDYYLLKLAFECEEIDLGRRCVQYREAKDEDEVADDGTYVDPLEGDLGAAIDLETEG